VASGRSSRRTGDAGRDSGPFVALPWSVLDCAAYARLSHPARSLLLEFARQFVRDNNGRLLASARHLSKRGWKSSDVITRAKRELLAAGFIFETVMGMRPNRASWYAVTWYVLDRHPNYDAGATTNFVRGAYRLSAEPQNVGLKPSRGLAGTGIAPLGGTRVKLPIPSRGAINTSVAPPSTPPNGNHLDMPSAVRNLYVIRSESR
jgi:hypothetical protein